jgi:ubiquinone/menaquinone biosynthesis C-methylase UbiE
LGEIENIKKLSLTMKKDKNHTISEVEQLYDNISQEYDTQEGHGINEDEKEVWKKEIFTKFRERKWKHTLDVGCGTGLLTTYICDLKLSDKVTGLELSTKMLKEAKEKKATLAFYEQGDTHQSDMFNESMFDCIISRQVVCHFYDPLTVFQNWYKWLEIGGIVIIVDGLWLREGWENDNLVDKLPLSCLQTRATIEYLLSKVGFEIIDNFFLGLPNKRYCVVAKKF